ncbi:MAG: chorismate synthase [Candidatus Ornithospirochaeta sp.]
MSGNTFGKIFSFTTFGESHGKALGTIIDGMPSGVEVDESFLSSQMARRRPGQSAFSTQRKEGDEYKILSGVFEGKTTGTPIAVIVENTDQRSKDYSNIAHTFRPGHADITYTEKYGIRDYRGGGRSSGRETLSRVIAGSFAQMALEKEGIKVNAALVGAGKAEVNSYDWNPPFPPPLYAPDGEGKDEMEKEIEEARRNGDSTGSIVECRIEGVPAGLGEPAFDKLDALLAHAMFSLGAVKGFEIGRGFSSSRLRGSENNDKIADRGGKIVFLTNNAGGILGGISNGDEIVFRTYFKPTPSISRPQETVTDSGENTLLTITGRHDPCIGPRAVVVVEAMAACVIFDMLLRHRCDRI